jgi:folate-dependent phosphoribosylglycinamide formyltransferase PurN
MKRLIVLVSGSGSNLQALIDAIRDGALAAEIVLVVSNRGAAYALERARGAGIPTLYVPLKPYTEARRSRAEYDADLAAQLVQHSPDLIVLAGKDSLRGTFEAAQRGEPVPTGCMVHEVVPEVDAGAVIDVEPVPVMPDDTLDTFAARMHAAEHALIVRALVRLIGKR